MRSGQGLGSQPEYVRTARPPGGAEQVPQLLRLPPVVAQVGAPPDQQGGLEEGFPRIVADVRVERERAIVSLAAADRYVERRRAHQLGIGQHRERQLMLYPERPQRVGRVGGHTVDGGADRRELVGVLPQLPPGADAERSPAATKRQPHRPVVLGKGGCEGNRLAVVGGQVEIESHSPMITQGQIIAEPLMWADQDENREQQDDSQRVRRQTTSCGVVRAGDRYRQRIWLAAATVARPRMCLTPTSDGRCAK